MLQGISDVRIRRLSSAERGHGSTCSIDGWYVHYDRLVTNGRRALWYELECPVVHLPSCSRAGWLAIFCCRCCADCIVDG